MLIRYAAQKDMQEIYELLCELEVKKMPYDDFQYTYKKNIEDENIHYLVVEEQNQLIGFGSIHIQNLLHHSKRAAEIQELIVMDKYRGHGIGAMLANKMMEISKEEDCELIEVCCNRKRMDAHLFYEKCGFKKSHYKFTKFFE